jgi:hypothetical protein
MKNINIWSRRKFSKAAISAQILISSGILNIPTGCSTLDQSKEGELLDFSLQNTLKLAMDEIIPQSNAMPSASNVGGVDYILDVLKDYPDLVAPFQRLLIELNTQSKESSDQAFIGLDQQQRIDVLYNFERTQPELFNILKDFVYESYYTNEEVWKIIGYEPYPTLSAGPEMDPFDDRLLERVKELSPLFIDIEN